MATCNICGKDAGYLHSICQDCRASRPEQSAQNTNSVRFRDNPLSMSPADRSGGSSLGAWIIGAAFVLILTAAFFMRFGNSEAAKDRGIKRMAIKQCWKDYERKSLDPETKRFIASSCEKIEYDLKQLYGIDP